MLASLPWWVGGIDRVDRQVLPTDGIAQGPMQTGMHASHRGGGEGALAVYLPLLEQLGIDGIDSSAGQVAQLHRAQLDDDVLRAESLVGGVGDLPHRRLDRRQPDGQQVGPHYLSRVVKAHSPGNRAVRFP